QFLVDAGGNPVVGPGTVGCLANFLLLPFLGLYWASSRDSSWNVEAFEQSFRALREFVDSPEVPVLVWGPLAGVTSTLRSGGRTEFGEGVFLAPFTEQEKAMMRTPDGHGRLE